MRNVGGCSRNRTYDRWLKRPLLYRLSYAPKLYQAKEVLTACPPLEEAMHPNKKQLFKQWF